MPSCFGNKLATLTRLPGPIRTLTSLKELRGENHPLNAPTEFMRLVNWLMGQTATPKDLFLVLPEESMVQTIREVSHSEVSGGVSGIYQETLLYSVWIQAMNSPGSRAMRMRHRRMLLRTHFWNFWIL